MQIRGKKYVFSSDNTNFILSIYEFGGTGIFELPFRGLEWISISSFISLLALESLFGVNVYNSTYEASAFKSFGTLSLVSSFPLLFRFKSSGFRSLSLITKFNSVCNLVTVQYTTLNFSFCTVAT